MADSIQLPMCDYVSQCTIKMLKLSRFIVTVSIHQIHRTHLSWCLITPWTIGPVCSTIRGRCVGFPQYLSTVVINSTVIGSVNIDNIRSPCITAITEIPICCTGEIDDGMQYISGITGHPVRHEATVWVADKHHSILVCSMIGYCSRNQRW